VTDGPPQAMRTFHGCASWRADHAPGYHIERMIAQWWDVNNRETADNE